MSKNSFYVTTTLPYVNAEPHIGFGLEIVEADVVARYQRLLGKEVVFNTGTDEHGQKIYQQALEAHLTPQAYCDIYAAKFSDLRDSLNLSYTHFIRTTEPHHIKAAQEFWRRCRENGYIDKKTYQTKYCIGCELEKTDSELIDGKCPLHPNKEIELREEENYFFTFSQFQQPLLDFYKSHPDFVQPIGKYKEIISFVEQGLQDFSISRLKSKMPWGIPVPDDEDHVMYVWFDALVNYISTIGWPADEPTFNQFWPVVQLAGKDNLRQQSAMWQAMLMAAGVTASEKILINGFISVDGQKMSKSLGNVIAPKDLVAKYGIDATRYLLISLGTFGEDMDVSWNRFDDIYKAELQNGLGNLCSRVAKMCEQSTAEYQIDSSIQHFAPAYTDLMDTYELSEVLNWIKTKITQEDKYLSEQKPWTKSGGEQQVILQHAVNTIINVAFHLQPFMPETAQTILQAFRQSHITALSPLFPRLG